MVVICDANLMRTLFCATVMSSLEVRYRKRSEKDPKDTVAVLCIWSAP